MAEVHADLAARHAHWSKISSRIRSKHLGYCESCVRKLLQGNVTGSLVEHIEPLDAIDSPGPDIFRGGGFCMLGAKQAVH